MPHFFIKYNYKFYKKFTKMFALIVQIKIVRKTIFLQASSSFHAKGLKKIHWFYGVALKNRMISKKLTKGFGNDCQVKLWRREHSLGKTKTWKVSETVIHI